MNAVKLLAGLAAILMGSAWGLDLAGLPDPAPDTASTSVSESASFTPEANTPPTKDASWPVTADSVEDYYLDIGETQLGKRPYPHITNGENYYSTARVDVVDENGYDHQAVVYICQGTEGFTRGFREFIEALKAAYPPGESGTVVAYREAHTRPKTYSELDINYLVVEEVSYTDYQGNRVDAVLVGADGDEAFLAAEIEIYEKFYREYVKDMDH